MLGPEQETLFALISVIIFIMVMFIIFLVFGLVTQKKVVALQKKLLKSEILSIERERERVSSDLHDSLAPTLSAIILLNNLVQTDDEPTAKIRNDIDTYLHKVSREIKEISRNITPRFYEDTFVTNVIVKAIQDNLFICDQKGISVTYNIKADVTLSKEQHLHLYRIIQELFNNACKHSQASYIHVTGIIREETLIVVYHDNGIGYDTRKTSEGLGLGNIQNRLSLLNGIYSIDSGENTGTEIFMRIPISPKA